MRKPENIIQLKPDERIVLVIREYSIMLLPTLAIAGGSYFTLLFLMYYVFSHGIVGMILWFVSLGLVLFCLFRKWWLWYGEVVIVTNKRCVDIQRPGLFSKAVKDIPWSIVADIQFSQQGVFATLAHYGSITLITTAHDQIQIQNVYQPASVRDILAEYVEKLC